MQPDQFLRLIKPDLTWYGFLVTMSAASFTVAWTLWRYEREFIREYVEKLKGLFSEFDERHILPLIVQHFAAAISSGLDEAENRLLDVLYPGAGQAGRPAPLVDDATLKSLVSPSSIRTIMEEVKKAGSGTKIRAFLDSPSGKELLDKLSRMYDLRQRFGTKYRAARDACRATVYAFLLLAMFLLIGTLSIVYPWKDVAFHMWVAVVVILLAWGVYSFCRLEYMRRGLTEMWEELELHDHI